MFNNREDDLIFLGIATSKPIRRQDRITRTTEWSRKQKPKGTGFPKG